MTKNPFVNAVAALVYIVFVVTVMTYTAGQTKHLNSFMIPITILSLFTLSAAVMGYIFLSQPAQLYLEGKKKASVQLFLQTVGVFACIPIISLILLLSRVFH